MYEHLYLVISFHSTIPFHIPVHIPFHSLETPHILAPLVAAVTTKHVVVISNNNCIATLFDVHW